MGRNFWEHFCVHFPTFLEGRRGLDLENGQGDVQRYGTICDSVHSDFCGRSATLLLRSDEAAILGGDIGFSGLHGVRFSLELPVFAKNGGSKWG